MKAHSQTLHWRIRAASRDDCPRLALIGAASFLDGFAGVLDGDAIVAHCASAHAAETYAHYFDAGAQAWLGEAQQGGAPLGYALLTRPDLPGGHTGADLELKRIYALSRCHGSGLAQALMDHAVAAARAAGAHRLMLGVYRENARALRFYARQGFEITGERHFRVGAQQYADHILALDLR